VNFDVKKGKFNIMSTKFFQKFDLVAFVANVLAVILGIIITFSLQGITDKHSQKKNVRSALQLVEDELKGCRNDLQTCVEMMELESKAAGYILEHSDDLFSCPKDSLSYYGTIVISEMILTVPSDALELLKSSSLFPAIGDNVLSMKILRAYDQCKAQQQIFSHHESTKNDIFYKASNNNLTGGKKGDSYISLDKLCRDPQGKTLLVRLKMGDTNSIITGLSDLENAIDAIEEYLDD